MMEQLFDFMNGQELQFASVVPDLLKCTICRKILINSRFTPCGCKFCLNCITKYLLDGCKPCPSGKEECADVVLNLKTDITKDSASDALISNMVVRCPQDSCHHRCRLKAMIDHVPVCSNRHMECEFSSIGCEERVRIGNGNGMANHLVTDNVDHMRLLVGFVRRMEREMQQRIDKLELSLAQAGELNERKDREWQTEKNELLTSMREMKAEMGEMKTVEQHTANEMQRMIRTNAELERSMQMQNKTIDEMRKNMKENGESYGSRLREEMGNKLKEDFEDLTKKLEPLERKMKESGEMLTKKWEPVEKKMMEDLENVAKILRQEMTDGIKSSQDEQMNKMHQSQDSMKVEHCQEMKALEQKLLQVIQRVQDTVLNNEFVWRVEEVNNKRQEAAAGKNERICSKCFFSHRNGYRMQLSLYLNGYGDGAGTHLSLFFRICSGLFDDVLQWPMNKKIRVAIVNQKTGQDHVGYDCSYEMSEDKFAQAYQKPTKENKGLGISKFAIWEELQKNGDVISNDVLFIRCTFVN